MFNMKIKPVEFASMPQYRDKCAHEAKQAMIESLPRRWRYMPLAAALLSVTLVLGIIGCAERVVVNAPEAVDVETPIPIVSSIPSIPPKPKPPTPDQPQVLKAGFINQSMATPSKKSSWDAFQRLAPDYGFEMTQFSGNYEPEVEVAGINHCIAEGYDAIFVNPSDINAVIPSLIMAKEAGMIVGMFASELLDGDKDIADFFCGFDDFLGGKLAGEFVSKKFPNGAIFVGIEGKVRHSQIKRHAGFLAGIAKNILELDPPHIVIDREPHETLELLEEIIIKYGDDISIVFCYWDHGVSSIIQALEAAGLVVGADGICVIGFDVNDTGYQQVKDGTQSLSIGLNWADVAAKSLENAKIMLEGGNVYYQNHIPLDIVTIDDIDKN